MLRRTFIKNTLAAAPSLLSSPDSLFDLRRKKHIGLQLYTVRDEMKISPEKTLAAIAKIGYREVECAGYEDGLTYGMRPSAFRKLLIKEGLRMKSGLINTGRQDPAKKGSLINDFERLIDDSMTMGQEYIICSYLHDFERKTLDNYKKNAELFNKCGEICQKKGIQFGYHNHDFEFEAINDIIPYDLLLRECDDEFVKMEMDFYWITKAGKSPFDYFTKYPGRFPLWHIKDMGGATKSFTEVGNGIINYARIFAAREEAGMKHFYIEQDNCSPRKPLDSAKISFDYIKRKGF